jgi:hypothetical protein
MRRGCAWTAPELRLTSVVGLPIGVTLPDVFGMELINVRTTVGAVTGSDPCWDRGRRACPRGLCV